MAVNHMATPLPSAYEHLVYNMHVCVCLCVRERRKKGRGRGRERESFPKLNVEFLRTKIIAYYSLFFLLCARISPLVCIWNIFFK